MSEVRGSGREYQTAMAQERPRGATLCPMSGGRPRGDTQHLRSGAATRGVTQCLKSGTAAGRTNHMSKKWWLHGRRRAQRSYPTLKVRKGGGEEISLVQGKENGCALLEQL